LRFIGFENLALAKFLAIIVQINLVLMIFNLLPLPPLDGSKIIMPFLPYNWQVRLAGLEQYGIIFVLIFIMFGFSLVIPLINFLFNLIVGIS
jgi:Zn-dependent protease